MCRGLFDTPLNVLGNFRNHTVVPCRIHLWSFWYNKVSCSLLSFSAPKKKWNWVICRDVDGPRICHTEWSKSEREKQILYINAYIWNLEKWYRWTYLQGRNRNADIENGCVDTGEEGEGGMNWEIRFDINALPCVK